MEYRNLHDWNLSPEAAREIQRELAFQIRLEPLDVDAVRLVAGADTSFDQSNAAGPAPIFAGIVTLRLPAFNVEETAGVKTEASFPYVPGLLSFREIPPLLEAWSLIKIRPDVLIADGQGIAHPRRFGLACHLGLLLDLPTVGVAKRLLIGTHPPVPEEPGAWSPILHQGEVIGAALRSRAKVSPIYVSPGHKTDLESALKLVTRCLNGTRQPETTRSAHAFVNAMRKKAKESL